MRSGNGASMTPTERHCQPAAEDLAVAFGLVALLVLAEPKTEVAMAAGTVLFAVKVADVEPEAVVRAERTTDRILFTALGGPVHEVARPGWVGYTTGNPGLASVGNTDLPELGLEAGEQGWVEWTGHWERLSGLGRGQRPGCPLR